MNLPSVVNSYEGLSQNLFVAESFIRESIKTPVVTQGFMQQSQDMKPTLGLPTFLGIMWTVSTI